MMDVGNWKLFLTAGSSDAHVDGIWSEVFLRNALEFAEDTYGNCSPQAGMCLIELADFLEQAGRLQEAELVTERYRNILCHFAHELFFWRE